MVGCAADEGQTNSLSHWPGGCRRWGMEKLPLPEYDEVPLDQIAPGLTGLRILFVNVFAVAAPAGGWVLIDAGLPFSAGRIKRWAVNQFGDAARPRSILLTHGHFDHVGAVKDLADEWDVPIYAHPEEAPYLIGQREYPPPDPSVGGGVMALMSPLYPRGPINVSERLKLLTMDGIVPDLPDWRWLHTPGHTVGHISLFRDEDRVLLPGDAFCTTDQRSFLAVAAQRPELHGPPEYYTPDWDQAKLSVQKLAALRPSLLAPGHGLPMSGVDAEK